MKFGRSKLDIAAELRKRIKLKQAGAGINKPAPGLCEITLLLEFKD